MNWIENNPFKVGIFVCGIISLYAFLHHYIIAIPHNWSSFMLWLPVTWIIPMSASTLSYLSERGKE